jgi:hypothetical protein
MVGIAGNDGATRGSRAAARWRGRCGAGTLLIAATLGLTPGYRGRPKHSRNY